MFAVTTTDFSDIILSLALEDEESVPLRVIIKGPPAPVAVPSSSWIAAKSSK